MDWKVILEQGKIFLQDSAIDYINQCCDEEAQKTRESQKHIDISTATRAFVGLNLNDGEIYNLLNEYFKVDNISEAKDYVDNARVNCKIEELKNYYNVEGISNSEFYKFAKDHNYADKIKANPKLLDMSAEKLKIYLEKH